MSKAYLIAYNALSALGWGAVLVLSVVHIAGYSASPSPSLLQKLPPIISSAFAVFTANPLPPIVASVLPKSLHPLYERLTTTYAAVGPLVQFVQSFAVMEVSHVVLGWVRSSLVTTLMQVGSRLFVVYGVVNLVPQTHTNPFYATMILSWSFTEVIRYTYYLITLAAPDASQPFAPPSATKSFMSFLTYLRYTTFYVLYPTGAGSEAALTFSTLPIGSTVYAWLNGLSAPTSRAWTGADVFRAVMFLGWWPALYILYTHMIRQRRKVLNPVDERSGAKHQGGRKAIKTKTS